MHDLTSAASAITNSRKISVRGLTKSYANVVALQPTDLEVRDGEFLTLLGPSGSGKTTLLLLLAGLLAPDAGTICVDGRDVTRAAPESRDLGMVFQNYALFPHMTVFDNVAFPLRMRKVHRSEVRKRVARALSAVHLADFGDRMPSQLSGGQQQRVALARCMVYQPSVILMDEPLGALDKKLREQMQMEIKRLHKELKVTILYVTHDQEEALVMSDRICLMNNACVEQIGTPAELYFRPRSRFAAEFLGESTILPVNVEGIVDGRLRLSMAGGEFWTALNKSAPSLPPGKAIAVIRPEAIAVLENGQTAENELEAKVVDVAIAGSMTKIYLETADGTAIAAASPTRRDRLGLSAGERVRLGWSSEATVVLPTESGAKR